MTPAHHRRKDDPADSAYLHERGQGGDKVLAYGLVVEKWFRLVWPLITILSALFMATVWQPLRSIPAMQQQVVSLQTAQDKETAERKSSDSLSLEQRAYLINIVGKLTTIECFNLPLRDRIKYQLNDEKGCDSTPLPKE